MDLIFQMVAQSQLFLLVDITHEEVLVVVRKAIVPGVNERFGSIAVGRGLHTALGA